MILKEGLKTNTWLDKKFSSRDDIVDMIWTYIEEQSDDDSDDFVSLLINTFIEDWDWDQMEFTKDTVRTAIDNVLSEKWIDGDVLYYIELIHNRSGHGISLEEIEDLFLDSEWKCTVTKSNKDYKPSFEASVEDVPTNKVKSYMNKIFDTIEKRLPEGWEISEVKLKKSGNHFNFHITMSKKLKSE